MNDLKNESKTFLIKYLDDYSQNLIENREQIDKFFEEYEVVAYKLLKEKLATPSKFSVIRSSWLNVSWDVSRSTNESSSFL